MIQIWYSLQPPTLAQAAKLSTKAEEALAILEASEVVASEDQHQMQLLAVSHSIRWDDFLNIHVWSLLKFKSSQGGFGGGLSGSAANGKIFP